MGAWYHATKFAVEGLSDCLRMELDPFGIKVVVSNPVRSGRSGAPSRGRASSRPRRRTYASSAAFGGVLAGADRGQGSPPEVVAGAVSSALSARRPRTRYVVGGGASRWSRSAGC
jgi:NAD(P)-dependent dehydrogenase (short-subunit alcohol dehydrogenase family)